MKRVFVLLLCCLLLTACGQNANPTQPTTSALPSSDPTTRPTGEQGSMMRMLHYYGLDEYREFVENAEIPEDFVYYESLTDFGEFHGLVILSRQTGEYQAASYSQYLYSFLDEQGIKVYLMVGADQSYDPAPVDSKYWGDMRMGDPTIDKSRALVVRNGIKYLYLKGGLYSVSWQSNGIWFSVDTEMSPSNGGFYPEDGSLMFIQELLHTDTNKAAVERFEAALNTPAVK